MTPTPTPVEWSHLSMKAYEYFLLCDVCGAMVHDSPTSQRIHENWHARVAEAILLLLATTEPAA